MKLPLQHPSCHTYLSGSGLSLWLLLLFVLLVLEPSQTRRQKPVAMAKLFPNSGWNPYQSDPNLLWFFPLKSTLAKYGSHNNVVCTKVIPGVYGEILGLLQKRICADLLHGGTGCFCASPDPHKYVFTLICGKCIGFPAIKDNCYPQINGMRPGSLGHPVNWHQLSFGPIFTYRTGCYQYDTDIIGPNFTQGAKKSPEECHEWCYNQSLDVDDPLGPCGEWTYMTALGACFLKKKGASSRTRYIQGFVSGKAMCNGLKG